jgi:hypothetical protein
MNETEYKRLLEESWRRKLTPGEENLLSAHLAAHPEAREEWAEEARLGQLLARLPEGPKVASNFTALVLQKAALDSASIERQKASKAEGISFWRLFRRWLPQTAVAGLVLCLALGYQEHQSTRRANMVRNVVELSEAVSSDPQFVEDFDSIRQMGNSPDKADTSLLNLMQ